MFTQSAWSCVRRDKNRQNVAAEMDVNVIRDENIYASTYLGVDQILINYVYMHVYVGMSVCKYCSKALSYTTCQKAMYATPHNLIACNANIIKRGKQTETIVLFAKEDTYEAL